MRLSKKKLKSVFVFKMVNAKSDFVGTETKIDKIGCFDCIVEESRTQQKNDNGGTETKVTYKLTVPNGYHFKEGYMLSLTNCEKPDMKITGIEKRTGFSECIAESWK